MANDVSEHSFMAAEGQKRMRVHFVLRHIYRTLKTFAIKLFFVRSVKSIRTSHFANVSLSSSFISLFSVVQKLSFRNWSLKRDYIICAVHCHFFFILRFNVSAPRLFFCWSFWRCHFASVCAFLCMLRDWRVECLVFCDLRNFAAASK